MSAMSAHLATVLRLSPGLLTISARRHARRVHRPCIIDIVQGHGHLLHPSRAVPSKPPTWENNPVRAAPPVPGARPSCSNCSILIARGAQIPVLIWTNSYCTSTPRAHLLARRAQLRHRQHLRPPRVRARRLRELLRPLGSVHLPAAPQALLGARRLLRRQAQRPRRARIPIARAFTRHRKARYPPHLGHVLRAWELPSPHSARSATVAAHVTLLPRTPRPRGGGACVSLGVARAVCGWPCGMGR